jgi:uncharacterized membrane protein YhiD involved in acid resistance
MFLVSVSDIFGDLSSATATEVPVLTIVFSLLSVFLLSLIILFTYRKSYQTTVYNRSFAISLPIVSMVTAVIIISVSSNIILSLGMVGALSIVRFRTALKNPFDTVFMFWAVGLGITVGAGLITIAAVSTIIIAVVIVLLIALEMFVSSYFLIIRATNYHNEDLILDEVQNIFGKYTVRNKTIKDNNLDLTIEVRTKSERISIVNSIKEIESVKSVILLSHQGDYIAE